MWAPLPDALTRLTSNEHRQWLWTTYVECMLGGWEPPSHDLDIFFFGDAPEMAAKLSHLVLCGAKRGTAAWLRATRLTSATIPHPGLISIVTDGFGYPRCAVQTEDVRILRFSDVDETLAALEGEGDLTLEDWREGHRTFFQREAQSLAIAFDENEELFLERFRVLKVLGRSDGPTSA